MSPVFHAESLKNSSGIKVKLLSGKQSVWITTQLEQQEQGSSLTRIRDEV